MIYSVAKLELRKGIWSNADTETLAARLRGWFNPKRPFIRFAAKDGGIVIEVGNTGLALWEIVEEIEHAISVLI